MKLILSALEVENLKPINPQLGEVIDDELNLAENNELPDADWYPDPMNQDEFRFWNGTEWTEYVSNNGVVSESPL